MIRFSAILFSFSLLTGAIHAQERQLDQKNMREGEAVEYCFTAKKMAELKASGVQLPLRGIKQIQKSGSRGVVYKIPVVFHILHANGPENISNEQVLDAVAILNRDYRLQNSDATQTHTNFNASNPNAYAIPSDVEIEFVLATKAPDGSCFNGITRTFSPLSQNGEDGMAQLDAIMNGNNVYQGEWNSNNYLNFIVCGDIGGAAGYAYYPGSWNVGSMNSSIWILHNYTGSIGTSNSNTSRALTHEVGHWLGLAHTWGDSNGPAEASNCDLDDFIDDTPLCKGSTACNLNANTCVDTGIWGVDAPDNIENYMEYSYCSKMFTQGQVDAMRNELNQSYDGRNNLWTTSNLNFTGTNGTSPLCFVNFTANKTDVCLGSEIQFTDLSNSQNPTWQWTFDGGTPATSTEQNPTVSYLVPGLHSVTLILNNATGSVTEVKNAYIRVSNTPASLPILEDFESYSTTAELPFSTSSSGNNAKWELTNTAGHTGTKSIKLENFTQNGSNSDAFISEAIDLASVTAQSGVTLSFRYAYRKKSSANSELLQVAVSNDCGETFFTRKTISGSSLSSETSTENWTPTQSDWVTAHVTNITSNFWVSNFKYRFNFEGNGGNNVFIDNINIYTNDQTSLGIQELQHTITGLELYPNPVEHELTIHFEASHSKALRVSIVDLTGKVIQKQAINALTGKNEVHVTTSTLAPGMYFVQVGENQSENRQRFIVK